MITKSKEQVKLIYGLNDDKIIHISDIKVEERGLKCNCICPNCGDNLQAKLGHGKKTPHFAHNCNECDLEIAAQTALHILAKEILGTKREIVLPAYKIQLDYDDESKLESEGYNWIEIQEIMNEFIVFNENRLKFDHVYLEKKLKNIVPDIIIEKNGRQLIIEIAVTHFVDDIKFQAIKGMNISAVEIDLSDLRNEELIRENIENVIINSTQNKKWIHNIKYGEAKEKLKARNEVLKDNFDKQHKLQAIAERAREKELADKQKKIDDKKQKSRVMIQNALSLENYNLEIYKRRNSIKAFKYINNKRFYIDSTQGIPFYVDIPILGEIAFDCDRRIWQSAIFDMFIYFRGTKEFNCASICLAKIIKWIFEHQSDFRIVWELNECNQIQINEIKYHNALFYLAIKQYLSILAYIGFIDCDDIIRLHSTYPITPRVVVPPNSSNAKILMKVLHDNKQITPLIDEIIGMGTFNKHRGNIFDLWDRRGGYNLNRSNRDFDVNNSIVLNISNEKSLDSEKKRETEYLLGKNEANVNLDLYPEPIFLDAYDRRWLVCNKCKQLKRDDEMAFYREKAGECSACFYQ